MDDGALPDTDNIYIYCGRNMVGWGVWWLPLAFNNKRERIAGFGCWQILPPRTLFSVMHIITFCEIYKRDDICKKYIMKPLVQVLRDGYTKRTLLFILQNDVLLV